MRGTLARFVARTLLRSPALPIAGHLSAPALQHLRLSSLREATLVEAIDSLLGPMSRRDAVRIARGIIVNTFRRTCLKALRGPAGRASTFAPIRWSDAAVLRDLHARRLPAILATWHCGPELRTGVALEHLGVPATVLAAGGSPGKASRGIDYLCVRDPTERGLALKRAFARLKGGGLVVMAIDGRHSGGPIEVPFLGRRILVGRGAAALSRMTGAPILPVVKTWAGGTVDIRCCEALQRPQVDGSDPDTLDRALTLASVRWFEGFIRSAPERLQLRNVARLCRAPLLGSARDTSDAFAIGLGHTRG